MVIVNDIINIAKISYDTTNTTWVYNSGNKKHNKKYLKNLVPLVQKIKYKNKKLLFTCLKMKHILT